MKKLGLMGAALMFVAQPASAQVERYKFDDPHTQVVFMVNHMGFSNSIGKFTDYEGTIEFNRDEPAKSTVEVTIETDSLDFADDTWNEHVEAADMLNVEKFPTMTFKSTNIDVTGEKTAKITGDLTLLGVTKPVVLDTVFNNAGKAPMGNVYKAGFSATGTLKRSDFGMTKGIPMVGDEIKLIIEVEANREGGEVTAN